MVGLGLARILQRIGIVLLTLPGVNIVVLVHPLAGEVDGQPPGVAQIAQGFCLLYTSDAADE